MLCHNNFQQLRSKNNFTKNNNCTIYQNNCFQYKLNKTKSEENTNINSLKNKSSKHKSRTVNRTQSQLMSSYTQPPLIISREQMHQGPTTHMTTTFAGLNSPIDSITVPKQDVYFIDRNNLYQNYNSTVTCSNSQQQIDCYKPALESQFRSLSTTSISSSMSTLPVNIPFDDANFSALSSYHDNNNDDNSITSATIVNSANNNNNFHNYYDYHSASTSSFSSNASSISNVSTKCASIQPETTIGTIPTTNQILPIHPRNEFRTGTCLFYCQDEKRLFWSFPLRTTKRVTSQHLCSKTGKIMTRSIGLRSKKCNGSHHGPCVVVVANGIPPPNAIQPHFMKFYQYFEHYLDEYVVLENIIKNIQPTIAAIPQAIFSFNNVNNNVINHNTIDDDNDDDNDNSNTNNNNGIVDCTYNQLQFQEPPKKRQCLVYQNETNNMINTQYFGNSNNNIKIYNGLTNVANNNHKYDEDNNRNVNDVNNVLQLSQQKLIEKDFNGVINLLTAFHHNNQFNSSTVNNSSNMFAIYLDMATAYYFLKCFDYSLHYCNLIINDQLSLNQLKFEATKLRARLYHSQKQYEYACQDYDYIFHSNSLYSSDNHLWRDKLFEEKNAVRAFDVKDNMNINANVNDNDANCKSCDTDANHNNCTNSNADISSTTNSNPCVNGCDDESFDVEEDINATVTTDLDINYGSISDESSTHLRPFSNFNEHFMKMIENNNDNSKKDNTHAFTNVNNNISNHDFQSTQILNNFNEVISPACPNNMLSLPTPLVFSFSVDIEKPFFENNNNENFDNDQLNNNDNVNNELIHKTANQPENKNSKINAFVLTSSSTAANKMVNNGWKFESTQSSQVSASQQDMSFSHSAHLECDFNKTSQAEALTIKTIPLLRYNFSMESDEGGSLCFSIGNQFITKMNH